MGVAAQNQIRSGLPQIFEIHRFMLQHQDRFCPVDPGHQLFRLKTLLCPVSGLLSVLAADKHDRSSDDLLHFIRQNFKPAAVDKRNHLIAPVSFAYGSHREASEKGLFHIMVSIDRVRAVPGTDSPEDFRVNFGIFKAMIGAGQEISCGENQIRVLFVNQIHHALYGFRPGIDAHMKVRYQGDPQTVLPVFCPQLFIQRYFKLMHFHISGMPYAVKIDAAGSRKGNDQAEPGGNPVSPRILSAHQPRNACYNRQRNRNDPDVEEIPEPDISDCRQDKFHFTVRQEAAENRRRSQHIDYEEKDSAPSLHFQISGKRVTQPPVQYEEKKQVCQQIKRWN